MREHPLVPVLRFGLLCLALMILCPLHPEYGLFALGSGFGWWPGCGCCGSCGCTSTPANMQLTIVGLTNNLSTHCTGINATYTLPFNSFVSATVCRWTFDFASPVSCPSENIIGVGVDVDTSGPPHQFTGYLRNITFDECHDFGTPPDKNCSAYSGIASTSTDASASCCINGGSTYTITAIP